MNTHRSYEVPAHEAELAEPLGFPVDCTTLLSEPLFMKEELQGLLLVGSALPLPRANRDTLEALTAQVALALDSAALTEDLLRQQTEARSAPWSRTRPTSSWWSTRIRPYGT